MLLFSGRDVEFINSIVQDVQNNKIKNCQTFIMLLVYLRGCVYRRTSICVLFISMNMF